MLTFSYIFSVVISPIYVSDAYGLIQCIIQLICIAPHYNMTMPLVQNSVLTNGLLHGIPYLYAALLGSMTLYMIF